MKSKFNQIICFLLASFLLVSCADEDSNDSSDTDGTTDDNSYNGVYSGKAFDDSSNETGSWLVLVYDGKLYGISSDEEEEIIFNGTVSTDGKITGTGTSGSFTTIIEGTISSGKMSGSWSDDEDSGTFSGEQETDGFNGGYAGEAFQGSTQTGTWLVAVHDGQLYGVSTGTGGEILFSGNVSNDGSFSGEGTGSFEGVPYTTIISGNISEDTMSGVWSDDEDSGTFTGKKI